MQVNTSMWVREQSAISWYRAGESISDPGSVIHTQSCTQGPYVCSPFWCNSALCLLLQEKLVHFIIHRLHSPTEYQYDWSDIGSTALMSAVNYTFMIIKNAYISTACSHGCGSILTEIEKLLHGKRRGGEFGEMFNVFGRTGQSGVFHDKPDELHCCSCFLRIPLAEPAPRLLWRRGVAVAEVESAPANEKARAVDAPHRGANGRSCRRDQCCLAAPSPDRLVSASIIM